MFRTIFLIFWGHGIFWTRKKFQTLGMRWRALHLSISTFSILFLVYPVSLPVSVRRRNVHESLKYE